MRLLNYLKPKFREGKNNRKIDSSSSKKDSGQICFKVVTPEEHQQTRNSAYKYIIP